MSWKRSLKLTDVETFDKFEMTCKKCRLAYVMTAKEILEKHPKMKQHWLDEVERDLRCRARTCGGSVTLLMTHQKKIEGFVGGMA